MSPPWGTSAKKSPPTISQRSATPAAASAVDAPCYHLRLVEEDAVQRWIRLQDRGEEETMTAANIYDALDARKIVDLRDRRARARGISRHRLLEDLASSGCWRR